MFPASTKAGGMSFAFPNACKVPSNTGTVVVPLPSIAQLSDANDCSQKVKIENKAVVLKGSKISSSNGDQAGTLKGVVSSTSGDEVGFKTYAPRVKVEGSEVVTHLKTTGNNGSNANAPAGVVVSPSQVKVLVGM